MNKIQYPCLYHFLGSYLHEDWAEDSPDVEAIIKQYVAETGRTDVFHAICEIDQLLDESRDDLVLGQFLFKELRCYFDPRPSGKSNKAWLLEVRDELKKLLGDYKRSDEDAT